MSGHSKWHSIKHKKAKEDAKRGKVFTRLIKELTVAARMGGGDPDGNPRLRTAIAGAKAANMPQDNITRAIKKGTGELPGVSYEEITYEGYGPGGAAIMLEVMTDNKNRTIAEIRHLFSKHNGNLGATGCVSYLFQKKGLITVRAEDVDEDTLLETVLEAGAEDMERDEDVFEITTEVSDCESVSEAIKAAGYNVVSAELTMIPSTTVEIEEEKKAAQIIRLMEGLEDQDDVQNVYSNFDIPENIMKAVSG